MPTTVRSSSSGTTASGTSVSITAPAGTAAGDLVLVVVSTNNDPNTISDNNGSTPFTKDATGTCPAAVTGQNVSVFSRRIASGDPASYSFNISGAATRVTGVAVAFQNPNPSTIYDAAPVANAAVGSGTTQTALSVTTTTGNAINCVVFCADNTSNTISGLPAGYTVEQNVGDERIAFTDKVIAAPGATGNLTATQGTSDGWVAFQWSIADVGGAIPVKFTAIPFMGR